MNGSEGTPTSHEPTLSLIINSGIYRHHTLRSRMRDVFFETGTASTWDTLKASHWEILYYLIECRLHDRKATISDIPRDTGVPPSTSRRVLRRLEDVGLVNTVRDGKDKRRFDTELTSEYQQLVDDFVADYTGGFAGLIQKHDKQERKVAQKALERTREELLESEARLIQAQSLTSIGHFVWNRVSNTFVAASEEVARIHGVSVTDFTNRKLGEWDDSFIHPDDVDRVATVVLDAIAQRSGYEIDYRIIRADGVIRHVREIDAGHLGDNSRTDISTGTIQDITDRTQAEEALREREIQITQALKLANMGTWVWDCVRHRYDHISPQFANLYGYDVDEFLRLSQVGNQAMFCIHPDDIEWTASAFIEFNHDNQDYHVTYRIIRRDGAVRTLRDVSHRVSDENNKPLKGIGCTQDITDFVEAEEAE